METSKLRNTVSLAIFANESDPPRQFPDIPWYPGITVLEAMIIAQAMYPRAFEFQLEYNSVYGAFVNKIDEVPDAGNSYWLVYVDGVETKLGVSESILIEDPGGQNVEVEWKFKDITKQPGTAQALQKTKAAAQRLAGAR